MSFQSGVPTNSTNSPHPQIRVVNTGTGPLNLNNVEVRYWLNCDCAGQALQVFVDWAGLQPSGTTVTPNVQASVVATALGGQTHYLSFRFTGGMVLQPGQFLEIQARFNKSDWSNMFQDNDWSFRGAPGFTSWTHITGYQAGTLVWGQEPVSNAASLTVASVVAFPNPSDGEGTNLAFSLSGSSPESSVVNPTSQVDPDMEATFKAYTSNFRLIWSKTVTGPSFGTSGNHILHWDQRDNWGGRLGNGVYYLHVTVKSRGTVSSKISKLLIMK